jgi:hypothetical protein
MTPLAGFDPVVGSGYTGQVRFDSTTVRVEPTITSGLTGSITVNNLSVTSGSYASVPFSVPSDATLDLDDNKWNLPITVQVSSAHPFIRKTYNLTVIRNGIGISSSATSGVWLRYANISDAFLYNDVL